MRDLLVLVLTLGVAGTWSLAADPRTEEDAQEAVSLLVKSNPSGDEKAAAEKIRKRAAETPEFRSQLVAELLRRLDGYKEPYKGNDELRALGELQATEAAPALLRRWKSTPKKMHQIPLIQALAASLSGDERRDFLVGAMDDADEHPQLRMEAILILCKSEDPKGIRHLLEIYERDRKRYGNKIVHELANDPKNPTTLPWDQDADGMSDYIEKVLLLDPTLPDTDRDGIPDGSDRNPLTAPWGELSENQRIGSYLVYLHTTYLMRGMPDALGTPPGVCIVLTTDKWMTGSDEPSLLAGVELVGTNNVILALSPPQCQQYDQLLGPNRTPKIMITCISEPRPNENPRSWEVHLMLMKRAGMAEGEKLFDLHEGRTDGGVRNGQLIGNGRSWLIRVRKIGDVWLPVGWQLHITS